jgi:isoleucyl-tRNA synthetase
MRVNAPEGSDTGLFDGGSGVVVVDTRLYPELEREGHARDVVRLIQQTRKEAGFDVSDRIRLTLVLPAALVAAIEEHRERIMQDTLAVEFTIADAASSSGDVHAATHEVGGESVTIEVTRAA